MQPVSQALNEVKELYREVVGTAAPTIPPEAFVSFPLGVDPLSHVMLEYEQLKQFSEQLKTAPKPVAWVPQADCVATPDAFIIRMEVPGISREDMQVFVANGECVVRGERKPPQPVPESTPVTTERPWGPFERRFVLPKGSRFDAVKARYVDGILELDIPVQATGIREEKKVDVD